MSYRNAIKKAMKICDTAMGRGFFYHSLEGGKQIVGIHMSD